MTTFQLFAAVTVTAITVVEAETLAEAIDIANDRCVVIGGNGSGADIDTEWVIEDADGEPENIHAD